MGNSHCRVFNCKENHPYHYCKVCQEKNSDHFSRHCPKSTILYHATNINNYESIKKNGFIASNGGTLGAGVYFSDNSKTAQEIAINKANFDENTLYIPCRVYLGNSDDKAYEFDINGNWRSNFDSASRIHGSWGACNENFKEYCVKDTSRIKLLNPVIKENNRKKKEKKRVNPCYNLCLGFFFYFIIWFLTRKLEKN